MQLNYKQSQFELFPGAVNGSSKTHRPQFLFSSITLSLENLVISSITVLMAFIFAFSAGVERGKKVHLNKFNDDPFTEVASVAQKPQPILKIVPQKKPVVQQAPVMTQPVAINSANSVNLAASAASATMETTAQDLQTALQGQNIMSGNYTVQVASFKKDEYAQKEALMLKKKGYDIIVVPKGSYSIVCVGKFSRKEQASTVLSQLKKTYKDCVLRRM